MYTQILIAAFGGGAVRGIVGFIKHKYSYKNVKFDLSYFIGMMFMSGMVGLLSATAVNQTGLTFLGSFTPALGFIVGYAGGDFIENIYKIIIKKSNLYKS